jgi:2-C-methyl-D-erythritol 4-phosphate cytidylyltransferase/2-C-methyl-D-erythritol 2,4-cyclodiphosphate synthase
MVDVRVGIGFDVHRFKEIEEGKNSGIPLCGIIVPHNKAIEAHSDGDVAIHAIVDAILGAISEGDIGTHFPPSDPKWKNANSEQFLLYANNLLINKGGKINNIDTIIICEKPKVGPYREQMKENLARILNIARDRVSVKATTTEKLGFTGREEGIAAQAIVSITLS